ncbi:Alpha/Beta hydrolase protein [Haematococcus lacustris]
MAFTKATAALMVVVAALCALVARDPDIVYGFPGEALAIESAARSPDNERLELGSGVVRTTVHFPCSGERCQAWLYTPRPSHRPPPPVIVMAAGLGVQRDHKLPGIAEHFASHGYAALLFDYRGWGGSGGLPRHLVNGRQHVLDYQAAMQHIQSSHGFDGRIDPGRVVLWGSSYSGGHSLVAASHPGPNQRHIRAVIAMEPYVSGALALKALFSAAMSRPGRMPPSPAPATTSPSKPASDPALKATHPTVTMNTDQTMPQLLSVVAGVLRWVRLLGAAAYDAGRGALGLPAIYIPLVLPDTDVTRNATGARGWLQWLYPYHQHLSMGIMPEVDYSTFMSSRPKTMLGGWVNLVAPRLVWRHLLYSPLAHVEQLSCPVLLIAGGDDTTTTPHSIQTAAEFLRRKERGVTVEYVELAGRTHISLYNAPQLLPTMTRFLDQHVPL